MELTKEERARAAKNAYARQWRAKNPDKVKAAQDRYWGRVAEQEKEVNTPTEEKPRGGEPE